MTYNWYDDALFQHLKLRTIEIDFVVLNQEIYEDRDYPHKSNFKHPWQNWAGVDVDYMVDGILVKGHRGKTVWYMPAKTEAQAGALQIEKGQALKIVKYPVLKDAEMEYNRLMKELAIQKTLFFNEMAADIYEVVLVRNRAANTVKWFDEIYVHQTEALYMAQIVEDLQVYDIPNSVYLDEAYAFTGQPIERFKQRCEKIGIQHYDIGLGNLFCDANGHLKVIDVHKWDWIYDLNVPEVPEYLQIELNNTCNAKCGMCAIPNMQRTRGLMSDALLEKILYEAQALGIRNITPFLHGEPFLRPDFIEKLHKINAIVPEAQIDIFTNASKMAKNQVEQLKQVKNLRRLNFSVPGGDRVTYEHVTQLEYDQTKENIEYALNTLTCSMTVTMPLFSGNHRSEKAFYNTWSSYKAHTYSTYNYIDHGVATMAPETATPCDRILRSMTVLWDGRVGICCLDSEGKFILGDLNKQSIEAVWHSESAIQYRDKHIVNRKLCKPCKTCNQVMLPPLLNV